MKAMILCLTRIPVSLNSTACLRGILEEYAWSIMESLVPEFSLGNP